MPGDAGRRQGAAQERHPRRQPGGVHRGRDALQHEGRGARGRAPRPARQGRRQARRAATSRIVCHSKTVARGAQGGRAARRPRASTPRWSTCAPSGRSTPRRCSTRWRKTHRCVVVEEGWPFAGVGAQVVDVDPARGLRRARRAGAPGHRRRRADAVQQAPREGRQGRPGEGRRRGQARCCTWDLTHGNQSRDGGALADDGRRAPRRVEEEEGDPVAVGDVLAEVETDKAVMELVARAAGTLLKQLVPAGATVPVAELVGVIGQPGEAVRARWQAAAPAARRQAPTARGRQHRSRRRQPPPRRPRRGRRPPSGARRPAAAGGRVKASPARPQDRRRARASTSAPSPAPAPRAGSSCATSRAATAARAAGGAPAPRARPPSRAPRPRPPSPTSRSPRSGRRSPSGWRSRSARSRPSTSRPRSTWSGLGGARGAARRGRARSGEGLVQRHHHQGDGHRAAAAPGVQRLVAGRPHPLLERGARRHGGGGRGRADHAGDPARRPEDRCARSPPRRRTWPAGRASAGSSPRSTPAAPSRSPTSACSTSTSSPRSSTRPRPGSWRSGSIVEQAGGQAGRRSVPRRRLRLTMSCDHRVIDGATGAQFLQTLKGMLENPLAHRCGTERSSERPPDLD